MDAWIARARNVLSRRAFPHEFAWLIDNPVRRLFVTPERLVARMSVAPDCHVMELGPGSGYFSKALAQAVHAGRLTLVDLQEEMLRMARAKIERCSAQMNFVASRAEDLPFRPETFDAIVLVTVLGEVKDTSRCLADLHRQLRRTGKLVIHEHWPDPDFLRFATVVRLGDAAGFQLQRRFGGSWNYTAVFGKA